MERGSSGGLMGNCCKLSMSNVESTTPLLVARRFTIPRMYADGEALKHADMLYILWLRKLQLCLIEDLAAKVAARHCQDTPTKAVFYKEEANNRCYKVTFATGRNVVVRLPKLGIVALRREKVESELCVMDCLSQHSSIPIPRIFGSGVCDVGPYMVLEFIDGTPLGKYFHASLSDRSKAADLDSVKNGSELWRCYQEMARIFLTLSRCQFSQIGCPRRDADGIWSVDKRPVTYNINNLLMHANFPPRDLGKGPYSTATDYFVALARDHMRHLQTQRNDAVADEMDCKKKYVARCLFTKIAHSFSTTYNNGPFCLYCDDLQPSEVIVDADLRTQSVINWEFCYVAPAEFTHCSPWWLLLEGPHDLENGIDDFLSHYEPRQQIFLSVLRECEAEAAAQGYTVTPSLSEHMERSMQDGTFWFCLAARSCFLFDDIYWKFIDSKYYGEFTSIEDRIALLSKDEQTELDGFYQMKMEQAAERTLDKHQTFDEILAS
ncbi:hypothetical protein ACO22_04512 [Paracoccidioides brasiliensis]|uniref:Aminoglycoside phosphotransferase domain-containing protein n=1 Tax=Paracoccidioides brasiliensis TaxID=121759 RepID=A0A1D2JCX2_PARBR|nr:hypothetical protein ACO22_04512 [Paracoccidioides brasiliensis]